MQLNWIWKHPFRKKLGAGWPCSNSIGMRNLRTYPAWRKEGENVTIRDDRKRMKTAFQNTPSRSGNLTEPIAPIMHHLRPKRTLQHPSPIIQATLWSYHATASTTRGGSCTGPWGWFSQWINWLKLFIDMPLLQKRYNCKYNWTSWYRSPGAGASEY